MILEQLARQIGVAAAWTGTPLLAVLACLEPVLRWAGWGGDLPFREASTTAFFAPTFSWYIGVMKCSSMAMTFMRARIFQLALTPAP